ncbi:monooxygenase 3 [Quercus suber]|uniref:Monooxygenase 3 n=1 Tax=Quercus suber TaxID=58331 RepID=A0AAW0LGY7_QUESU
MQRDGGARCGDSGGRNSRFSNGPTAVALKRVGVGALVLEKSEGLRATGAALGLHPNAWLALDALGVSHKLTTTYAPCRNSLLPFGGDAGMDMNLEYIVHRKALLEALAEELPMETVRYSSKLKSIVNQALIGCDGVHSLVAHWLRLTTPVNSGRWAVRGLAIFPEGHGLNHEAHQFVTIGKRAGFIPLNDKELYWFLTNLTSKSSRDLSTVTWAPLMFRFPWDVIIGNLSKGNITVAGDAMHPMTPDLGQGGCSALEDAVVLGRHIGNLIIKNKKLVAGNQVAEALERYFKERKWRVAGLIMSSYLAGWMQQDGSGWFMKFLRDAIFYRRLYGLIFAGIHYDCGKLPCVSSSNSELDNDPRKID